VEVGDLQVVDGRRAGCCDCIHRFVTWKLWEYDDVTLPLKLLWGAGWWPSIYTDAGQKLKLHSGVNIGMMRNMGR